MSRSSARAEFEREQAERDQRQPIIEAHLKMVHQELIRLADYSRQAALVNYNLTGILREGWHYQMPDGKDILVKDGENKKDENKNIISYGTRDIFGQKTEFYGKPFYEVSRMMTAHFRIYCLVNGLTEKELYRLAEENPSKEIMDKVRNMRKGFFDMVTQFDRPQKGDGHEAAIRFYTGLGELVEQKMSSLRLLSDPKLGISENRGAILMFGEMQSYVNQTLRLDGQKASDSDKEFHQEVNDALREQGKKYNLDNISDALTPIDNVLENPVAKENNPIKNKAKFDFSSSHEADVLMEMSDMNQLLKAYTNGIILARELEESFQKNVSSEENLANAAMVHQKLKIVELLKSMNPQKYLKNTLPQPDESLPDAEGSDYNILGAAALSREMKNNFLKNIFGKQKKNSREYDNIQKLLGKIGNQERGIIALTDEKKTARADEISNNYNTLKEMADAYLADRNPHYRDEIERYKLMLRVRLHAERQMKSLADLKLSIAVSKGDKTAKVNLLRSRTEERDRLFNERKTAIDSNKKLSPEEKKLEHQIAYELFNLSTCMAKHMDGTDAGKKQMIGMIANLGVLVKIRNQYAKNEPPLNNTQQELYRKALKNKEIAEQMLKALPTKPEHIIRMDSFNIYKDMIRHSRNYMELNLQHSETKVVDKQAAQKKEAGQVKMAGGR